MRDFVSKGWDVWNAMVYDRGQRTEDGGMRSAGDGEDIIGVWLGVVVC
jgi:hypothetical protein